MVIPEQFTIKAHPALFEGEGWTKNKALLFQSTVDIHVMHFQKKRTKHSNLQLT